MFDWYMGGPLAVAGDTVYVGGSFGFAGGKCDEVDRA